MWKGRHEYTVLAFVPGSRPFDLFDPARPGRAKLYVRHVLITDDAEILPRWLRFVRLVVNSADLPLNVSRETIQESPVFAAIQESGDEPCPSGIGQARRKRQGKICQRSGGTSAPFLRKDFTRIPKGAMLCSVWRRLRPRLIRTAAGASRTILPICRPNQTAIYYLLGEDLARLSASPQIEGFRARGIEVLLLPDRGRCLLGGDGGWL